MTRDAGLVRDSRQFEAFQALRLIECAHPHHARLGTAARADHEPVRLGHDAELRFSTDRVMSYEPAKGDGRGRLALEFGLLGPDGPMPLHLTEYVRARALHFGDRTFERFLDVFHHRMSSLFYRAWAAGQPVIGLDRPDDDRFAGYVKSLCGLASGASDAREAVGEDAKRGAAALLGDRRRHASGLAALLTDQFGVPVRVVPFVGKWLSVPETARLRLGASERAPLGDGYVLGGRLWDRQQKFRIVVGPLSAAQSERLHPGTTGFDLMAGWVRQYVGPTLEFEFELILAPGAPSPMRLGAKTRLARHTWLGPAKGAACTPALRFSGSFPCGRIVSRTE